jgi:hypothetical protein
MKTNLAILALLFMTSFSASAQQSAHKEPLLDRLVGNWILQGTIAGHETTHDIESEWVLNHEYLRIHEASREKNAQDQPAYEAIVFIESNESSNEYRCLWLDSTGGGGLAVPAALGKRGNDEISFLFKNKNKDSGVHTTFAYSRGADTWNWLIDKRERRQANVFCESKAHQEIETIFCEPC